MDSRIISFLSETSLKLFKGLNSNNLYKNYEVLVLTNVISSNDLWT